MRCRGAVWAGVILLAAVAGGQPRVPAAGTAPVSPASEAAELVDLNAATAAELRGLPGIGNVYVRRILDGRPYTAKNQLLTRGILPQDAYAAIRDYVVAHRMPHIP